MNYIFLTYKKCICFHNYLCTKYSINIVTIVFIQVYEILHLDIKNHSPHKMTEWKKSQNKVQYFTVHIIQFIEFHQPFHWGPRGSYDKHHVNGSACHISRLPQEGQYQVVSYWLLCLVIVPASLPLPTSFMHML